MVENNELFCMHVKLNCQYEGFKSLQMRVKTTFTSIQNTRFSGFIGIEKPYLNVFKHDYLIDVKSCYKCDKVYKQGA